MSAPGNGARRHRVTRRRVSLVVQGFAGALSLLILLAFGYGWYNYTSLTRGSRSIAVAGLGDPSTPGPSSGTSPDAAAITTSASTRAGSEPGRTQNILIVGLDSRAGLSAAEKKYYHLGLHDQSTSTDTIIVVHVPADGRRATLVSIPRDSYVHIPGYRPNKINAAFVDGYSLGGGKTEEQRQAAGAGVLVATVKSLTGLTIDHYVQVGFSGFISIVNAIGDIPINLCQSVDDTYSHNKRLGISGSSGFKMSAGQHELNAREALAFVRQRHNLPGPVSDDLGRELRQRYFLRAAFEKVLSANVLLNPVRLHNLIEAVDGAFTFDNHSFGIARFASQMSELTSAGITGKSIPTSGSRDFGGAAGQALVVDPRRVQAFVHAFLYPAPSAAGSTRAHPHPSTPRPAPKPSTHHSAAGSCVH